MRAQIAHGLLELGKANAMAARAQRKRREAMCGEQGTQPRQLTAEQTLEIDSPRCTFKSHGRFLIQNDVRETIENRHHISHTYKIASVAISPHAACHFQRRGNAPGLMRKKEQWIKNG